MPWLFNPQNMTQTLTLRNGTTLRLPARKRYYLEPSRMSGDIQSKTASGLIRNMGGDRVVKQQEVKSDTSSRHHNDHDMVAAVSGETSVTKKVATKKRSARKRATGKSASTGKKKKSGS